MRAPTKENTLALAAVDIGGNSMQEKGHIRVWAVSIAGQETSPVLEGILGRQRWTVTHNEGNDVDTWNLKKNIYYHYFFICSVVGSAQLLLFYFFSSVAEVVNFIITINYLTFWNFFFFKQSFYSLYILLPLCWPFAVLWGFSFVLFFDCFSCYSFPTIVII